MKTIHKLALVAALSLASCAQVAEFVMTPEQLAAVEAHEAEAAELDVMLPQLDELRGQTSDPEILAAIDEQEGEILDRLAELEGLVNGITADAVRPYQEIAEVAVRHRDDGVVGFPTEPIMGGRHEGKDEIRAWFTRWFDRMPGIPFTLKRISVDNIFAMGPSNGIHVEWELDETDTDGNTFHITGVTAFNIEGGKATLVRDYIFDQDLITEIWPARESAAG